MKKIITLLLLFNSISFSFSQSKKKQIETLDYKLDSINSVLLRSIEDNEKLSEIKLDLESKVSSLNNKIGSKNDEISLKNEKIESLTKEVRSLEQDYQLVVADLILKSDSLDSISRTLDSIINEDNTSDRVWSRMNAYKDYYNFDDNTDKLRQLFEVILQSRVQTLKEFQGDYKNNIKELIIYKRDFGFKTLVDVIYEQGFVICQQEGGYYVEPKSSKCQGEQLEYD